MTGRSLSTGLTHLHDNGSQRLSLDGYVFWKWPVLLSVWINEFLVLFGNWSLWRPYWFDHCTYTHVKNLTRCFRVAGTALLDKQYSWAMMKQQVCSWLLEQERFVLIEPPCSWLNNDDCTMMTVQWRLYNDDCTMMTVQWWLYNDYTML